MGHELDWPDSESGWTLNSLTSELIPKFYVQSMVGDGFGGHSGGYRRPTFEPGWAKFMDESTWTFFRDRFLSLDPPSLKVRGSELETRYLMGQDWARYHQSDALLHVQKALQDKDRRYDELLFEHSKTLPPEKFVAFWTNPDLADYNDYKLGDVLYEYHTSHPEIEPLVVASPNRKKLLEAFRYWGPENSVGTFVGSVPLVMEDIINNFPELVGDGIRDIKVSFWAAKGDLQQAKMWFDQMSDSELSKRTAFALSFKTPESQTAELWDWVRSDTRFHKTSYLDQFSERILKHDPVGFMELYEASRKPDPEWDGIYSDIGYRWEKWYEKNPEAATLWLEKHPPGEAKDSLKARHAEELIMEAPTKSMDIAMTFTDPARRFKVLDQLINTWSRHDKPAVEQWLNSAQIPEADKAALRQSHLRGK